MLDQNSFPTRTQLWNSAILETIAHAVWTFHSPLLSYECQWDGYNYLINNTQGDRGAITFAEETTIGALFDHESTRSPYGSDDQYDIHQFLAGMPADMTRLAYAETLQYMLDNPQGSVVPTITTAFWNQGELITAAEPWPEVMSHGAQLLHRAGMEIDDAVAELRESYEFRPAQIDLIRSLYTRKIRMPYHTIMLDEQEHKILAIEGNGGIAESTELFAAIGVYLMS
jgi:hypothetical protein